MEVHIEMDSKQNYMRDMYLFSEIEDIIDADFINDIDWKKRLVNDIKYRDPDYNCDRLYDDVNDLFFMGKLRKGFDPYDKGQIVLLQDEFKLTTDYIGPSLTSMKRAGISDADAWKCILKCRTLGGHLIWPRLSNGINPSKASSGSRGYGITDRIDVALYELKCVLDNNTDLPIYNRKLRNCITREENMKWFGRISFHKFCERFYLIGSFVGNNDEILWLANPVLGKVDECIMRSYMESNINAISKRNAVISNLQRM